MTIETRDLTTLSTEPPTKRGFYQLITNAWWCCNAAGDPLVFKELSPQCNSSEDIARAICADLYPDGHVRYFEAIYMPVNPRDWA